MLSLHHGLDVHLSCAFRVTQDCSEALICIALSISRICGMKISQVSLLLLGRLDKCSAWSLWVAELLNEDLVSMVFQPVVQ